MLFAVLSSLGIALTALAPAPRAPALELRVWAPTEATRTATVVVRRGEALVGRCDTVEQLCAVDGWYRGAGGYDATVAFVNDPSKSVTMPFVADDDVERVDVVFIDSDADGQ